MRFILLVLLFMGMVQPSLAATPPLAPAASSVMTPVHPTVLPAQNNKAKKGGLFTRLKQKVVHYCLSKGMLQDGEPTAKQRKLAKWSMILGIGSIVLLFIPTAGLLAIPAAIVGLILGIKSLSGNSNTQGIIGIIASGLTLLLFLVAIILVAAFLASWN